MGRCFALRSRPNGLRISVKNNFLILLKELDIDGLDLRTISKMIEQIESATTELIRSAQGIQAIERNAERILASVKMLQINVSDLLS